MAVASNDSPSIGGVTTTLWKGSSVLSAMSTPYPHKAVNRSHFHGVKVLNLHGTTPLDISTLPDEQVVFDDVSFDTDTYFDDMHPTIITVPSDRGGVYSVGFSVEFTGTCDIAQLNQAWIALGDGTILLNARPNPQVSGTTIVLEAETLLNLLPDTTLSLVVIAGFQLGHPNTVMMTQHALYAPAMWIGQKAI